MLQVSFPDCVRWTTIEFDPQCGTAQPEDVLRLLIPSRTLHLSNLSAKPLIHDTINTWTELKKFSGSTGWPTTVLVLPGENKQADQLKKKKTPTKQQYSKLTFIGQ